MVVFLTRREKERLPGGANIEISRFECLPQIPYQRQLVQRGGSGTAPHNGCHSGRVLEASSLVACTERGSLATPVEARRTHTQQNLVSPRFNRCRVLMGLLKKVFLV
jgi:hypothetical protein